MHLLYYYIHCFLLPYVLLFIAPFTAVYYSIYCYLLLYLLLFTSPHARQGYEMSTRDLRAEVEETNARLREALAERNEVGVDTDTDTDIGTDTDTDTGTGTGTGTGTDTDSPHFHTLTHTRVHTPVIKHRSQLNTVLSTRQ